MLNFLEIHQQMKVNSVALFFKGYVTFDLIDSIIGIVSERLELLENDINIRKRVYGALTECLQNLCNHIEEASEQPTDIDYDLHSAIIMVDTNTDGYFIKTGNFIANHKVQELKNWLDYINTLDKDQLKQEYNKILTNKTFSDKGGGGLGLLDMARKSGKKLEYGFQEVDKKYSFFSFQINIGKQK